MQTPRVSRNVTALRQRLFIGPWQLIPVCLLAGMAVFFPLGGLSGQLYDPRTAPDSINTSDPSELFLKAYTSVQQGEKLEQDGKLRPALSKYRFAASLLEQLTQSNPNWQPLIVRYRLRNTTESIKKLEEKGALQSAPVPSGRPLPPGSPPGGDDDDLPAPDNPPSGVSATATSAGVPAPTAASQEALDRSTSDLRTRLNKAQKDLRAALDALATAQKEKQDALKERDNNAFQVQSARSESKTAQKRFERTKSDRDELQAQVDKAEARLKDLSSKNPDATQSRKELRDQLGELKKQLAKAQVEADDASKNRQEVDKKLAESEARNAQLTKERDAAVARSELTKDAAEKIEALQSENANLTQKLTAAEGTIARLTEESIKKKEELDGMQKELITLKDQLASSRDQNDRSATTITELRQQLDEGAKRLEEQKAKGMTSEDFARMTKENDLLRGIVMRQLKDQAQRTVAKKLLTDELARLDVQSAALNTQIEALGRPLVQLTDEERRLFKEPQVTIADTPTSAESVAVTITAVKPRPDATSGNGPAASASGPAGSPGADDHQPGSAPKVQVAQQPLVSEELKPKAREAKESFDRERFTDAERTYSELLARDPKNPYLLYNQGVVLYRQDKLKSAELVLKKAIAVTPKDASCLATLGIVYYKMHRYDDALIYLTQAIQLDPKNATAHNYLGITSSQKGWPEAALEELTKAIGLNPNYADAHFNIAVIYATNQPPAKDRAQEHYKKATSLGATPDPTLEKLIQK